MSTLRTGSSATNMPFVRAYEEVGYERALSTMVTQLTDPIITFDFGGRIRIQPVEDLLPVPVQRAMVLSQPSVLGQGSEFRNAPPQLVRLCTRIRWVAQYRSASYPRLASRPIIFVRTELVGANRTESAFSGSIASGIFVR